MEVAEKVVQLLQQYFPPELQNDVMHYRGEFHMLQEIRCRVQQPLCLRYAQNKEQMIAPCVTPQQMQYMVSCITQSSVYAWEEELRRGYLTLPGGFRVGLAGKGVLEEGRIRTLKQIGALNFRIVREVPGIADELMPLLYQDGQVKNCLIVSPPGGGKTTLLRDVVRQLSNGVDALAQPGRVVAIVDERSELAGSAEGIPQLDVGCRTDILDGCPKSEGIGLLLRSMSPQVIAVDEIGTEADVQALEKAAQSGVAVIATAHGERMEDVRHHPVLRRLIDGNYFSYIVLLYWLDGQVMLHPVSQARSVGDGMD